MKNLLTLAVLLGVMGIYSNTRAQVNTYPYTEDWESQTNCSTSCGVACALTNGWTNDTGDDQDWTVYSGITTSTNTGPTVNGGADHNPGIAGGKYVYTETSGCNNNLANLISPEFQNTGGMSNLFFEFWYHMYGANLSNQLNVDVRLVVGGVPQAWQALDSIPAQNVDLWERALIDLTAYIGDTIQIQLRTITGSSFGSDMALDDFSVQQIATDDAGVVSLDNPIAPLTTGINNIDVSIKNFGYDTLFNANIAWSVDGMLQTPFAWTGVLPFDSTEGPINIGTYNFSSGIFEVKTWTDTPNGVLDTVPSNDTITTTLCTSLSGAYTVGGAGADFSDMVELGNILSSCGVSNHVTITVNPGTYSGRMILDHVPGTGPAATITIDGIDASLVTMDNTSGFSNIYLNGTNYTTIKNITLTNNGNNDAYGIQLRDTASYNTFDSLIISMVVDPTSSDVACINASNLETSTSSEGANAFYTTVSNCQLNGAYYSIRFEGASAFRNIGNQFLNNTITNAELYGIYVDDQDSIVIERNTIGLTISASGDGIYCFDLVDFQINFNNVQANDYGLYVADGNFDATPNGRSRIENNMVSSLTDYACYLDDINEIDIWHNTFANESTFSGAMRINDFDSLDIRNNVFFSDGDFAFESDEDLSATGNTVNYNAYWSNGPNLIDEGFNVYSDLTAWQAGSPTFNGNSIEADPFFVGGMTDLHALSANVDDFGDNTVGILIDIDGDSRPQGTNVDMGADEFTSLDDDLALLNLIVPQICGDSLSPLYAVVSSLGGDSVFTFTANVTMSGDGMASLSYTYNDTMVFGQVDTILLGTVNTYWGINYDLSGYITLTGDQNNSNDTLNTSFYVIPFEPAGITGYACSDTSAYIYGTDLPGVQYNWFATSNQATDTVPLATADSLLVPNINIQDTYYLEYANNSDSLITTYAGGNGCGGGNMFDVNTTGGLSVFGVSVNTSAAVGTNFNVTLHYIPGGTYVGNETNAAAWTTIGTVTAVSAGAGLPSFADFSALPLNLPAGASAVYVEFPANYTNGNMTISNADMTITTGVGLCNSFGGVNNPRSFNGTLHYGGSACSNIRVPVMAVPGTFADSSFTATPTVSGNVVDFASSGASQNIAYLWDFGDGTTDTSANPQHTFTTDSTYIICLTATSNCGPATHCDTMDVCADMIADFSSSNVGATVSFTDLTGGQPTAWSWNFGDGNIDTTQNPQHTYAATGQYLVTLTTWNYCGDSSSVSVSADACVPPMASFSNLTSDGLNYNFSDSSTANIASWDWSFGDGNSSTQQNPNHTYAMNGTYTVTLVVTNECGDTASTSTTVNAVNIGDLELEQAVSISPNPSQGVFIFEYSGALKEEGRWMITDNLGKVVMEQNLSPGAFVREIDLTGMADGVYFLKVTVGDHQTSKRLVKRR